MRRRLSYANVMATLAFFFALTGGTMAATKYLVASDPIPATGDLTGTYGSPLIAAGKVTTGKIADGAITTSKFNSAALAPNAAKLSGFDVTTTEIQTTFGGSAESFVPILCPDNRVALQVGLSGGPDLHITRVQDGETTTSRSGTVVYVQNDSANAEAGTVRQYCLGSTFSPLPQ
jgi:hypothetical protein